MRGSGNRSSTSTLMAGKWPWGVSALLVVMAAGLLISDARGRMADARAEELGFLLAESQERARGLEAVFSRVHGELDRIANFVGEMGSLQLENLAPETFQPLADLDTLLVGFAILGPRGEILGADPRITVESAPELDLSATMEAAALRPGLVIEGGLLLADGRSVASFMRAVRGEEGDLLGFLHLLLELGRPSDNWPNPSHSLLAPTSLILDDLGHVLFHPEKEWIGWLLLAEADSLYDPQLYDILPEILSEQGGVWSLVSEVAAPDSWLRGLGSIISSSPIQLPNEDHWHLVLTVTEESGPIPGVPHAFEVGGLSALIASLLLGSALFLLLRGVPADRGRRGVGEEEWYRALVEGGADGLVVVSGQDRVVTANEAFARIVGVAVEELLGASFQELLDRPDVEGTLPEELKPGWAEARIRGADGSSLEVEMNTREVEVDSEVFLLALVRDVTWRRGIERETLRVGERERLLLGKELHDGLGQHLTGVAFLAKTLAGKLAERGGSEAEEASHIGRLVKDAVGQIRVLSKGLELAEYEAQGLPHAFSEMSGVVRRLMGVDLEVSLDLDLESAQPQLDRFLATQLYRLCHDVVSDAVRNRMAQNIRVSIKREGGLINLAIQHDGQKTEENPRMGITMPIYRLRYRARLLDAPLEVSDTVGGGTTVSCSFQVVGDKR